MSAMAIQDEIRWIEGAFAKSMRNAPAPLHEISGDLAERIAFKGDGGSGGWLGQFSPLTLLYPVLQAEIWSGVDSELVRRFTLAHLFFLVHAIIDDRQLDGQIGFQASDALMSRYLFQEGLDMIRAERLASPSHFERRASELIRSYLTSQLASAQPPEARPDFSVEDLEGQAIGRAALGALALTGLGFAAADAGSVERTMEAYDAIVLALQWADDAEDWREDWRQGQPNLVLALAGVSPRKKAYEDSSRGIEEAAYQVLATGAELEAFQRASEHFRRALDCQERLGGETLAGLIRKKLAELADRRSRLRREREALLLRQLTEQEMDFLLQS